MVAAVSSSASPTTTLNTKTTANRTTPSCPRPRSPLRPSVSDNNNNKSSNAPPPRRPKSREVTSRFLSSSSSSSSSSAATSTTSSSIPSSKRCASPLISRAAGMVTPARAAVSAPSPAVKRSQSAERRRPVTPSRPDSLDSRIRSCGEVSNAQRMLLSSSRSLSVSFQGESFSYQVSKAKKKPSPSPSPFPSPISARRAATPDRRRATTPTPSRGAPDHAENSRPPASVEQHQRWPARLRQMPQAADVGSRSVDFADDRRRMVGSSGINPSVVRPLQNLLLSSVEGRLSSESIGIGPEKRNEVVSRARGEPSMFSDTDSVSSEGSGINAGGAGHRGVRSVVVPARYLQETNSRLRRHPEPPGSPGSRAGTVGLRGPVPAKLAVSNKFGSESPTCSPRGVANARGQLSPIRPRPASPRKLGAGATPAALSSAMRGISPSRVRNGVSCGLSYSSNSIPSILSFSADIKRGKIGENKILEMHQLRILYNRLLQWRFVNARADAALSVQRLDAEKNLCNAHRTTSKLRESVKAKNIELQQLRQSMKLMSILKGQMVYLDELALVEEDYSRSLSGAVEALRASTLRLPLVGGARADVQNVKDAICSAVDVMQAMAPSICLLREKVGQANSSVAELVNAAAKGFASVDQCRDLLSALSSMQVKEHSVRAHLLQLKRPPMELLITEA